MNTNSTRKQQLLESKLRTLENGGSTRRMDDFLDELLNSASNHPSLTCMLINENAIRVQSQDMTLCEVSLRLAHSKFRTLCARLAVRCGEWTGRDISPYGDEIEFEYPGTKQFLKVRFENTSASHKIEIEDNSPSSSNNNCS